MVFGDFKDLKKRIASDKILRDKAFDIAKNPKYDINIKEVLLLGFINFLIKSPQGVVLLIIIITIIIINKISVLWTRLHYN